ncbi:hypothetical protein SLA_4000 [Streptomyces laurentii]|uniref:Transmembrane transport protein n=1 Tax=Streptomyces laurentii TaxID=39478 RepID=A0A160P0L5_STRLU|nr:hypothetical protein SLA_4000 [Streptomyces laurentii]
MTARQHRWTIVAALALTVITVAVLAASVYWSGRAEDILKATGCTVNSEARHCLQSTGDYVDAVWQARHMVEYIAFGVLLLPAVVSGYMAGPLVARELETGTYRLAWTQSASPARWLAAKLAASAVFTVALVVLVNLVFRWSWASGPADDFPTFWNDPTIYAALPGPVPVATVLLGLAVGALTGLLIRRTLPALLTSTLLTGGVIAAFTNYRAFLWPTETLTGQALQNRAARTWSVDQGMLTSSGDKVSLADCHWEWGCVTQRGGVTDYADVHPQSHFWPLQLVETGILLALAALALLAAFRVLRSRLP